MKPAFTRMGCLLVALLIVLQTVGAGAVASQHLDQATGAIAEVQDMSCEVDHSACPNGQLCNPALMPSGHLPLPLPLGERLQDPCGAFATFLTPPGPPPPLSASS